MKPIIPLKAYAPVIPWKSPAPSHGLSERLEPRRLLAAGDLVGGFGDGGVAAMDLDEQPIQVFTRVDELPDGDLIVAGFTSNADGTQVNDYLARLDAGGSFDAGFDDDGKLLLAEAAGASGFVEQVLALPDGDVLFVRAASVSSGEVIRLNADGSPDAGFATGGTLIINDFLPRLALLPGGGIVAAGGTLVRVYNANGSPRGSNHETSLAGKLGSANFSFADVATDDDGNIYVAGSAFEPGGNRVSVFKLAGATLGFDESYGTAGEARRNFDDLDIFGANSVDVDPQGRAIVAVGEDDSENRLVRFTSGGDADLDVFFRFDVPFNFSDPNEIVRAVAQPDEKILLGGYFISEDEGDAAAARFNEDGGPDASFGGNLATGQQRYDLGAPDDDLRDFIITGDGDFVAVGRRLATQPAFDADAVVFKVDLGDIDGEDPPPPPPPDAFAQLEDGTLTVAGTDAGDQITISSDGTTVTVIRDPDDADAESVQFARGDIDRVVVNAGDGNDDVEYGLGAPSTINAGAGNDTVTAAAGDDDLFGGDGADVLEAGSGNDVLDGGSGNDSLDAGDGADVMVGAAGDDTLLAGGGSDTISGGAGNDLLDPGEGGDSATGGDGADIVIASTGTDTLDGAGDGAPGTDNGDTIDFSSISSLVEGQGIGLDLAGGAGNLTGALSGTARNFRVVIGTAANDTILGTAAGETITGGDGNDSIRGGGGGDSVTAGAGDDRVLVTDADGDLSAFVLAGNDGGDTLDFSARTGPLSFQYGGDGGINADGFETLITNDADADITLQDTDEGGMTELVTGNGDDRLDASARTQPVRLISGPGSDTLLGGSGNDWFVPGFNDEEGDRVEGAGGMDLLDLNGSTDALVLVRGTLDDGDAGIQIGQDVEVAHAGGGDDTIAGFLRARGGAGNDTMTGSAGEDTALFGQGGADTLLSAFATADGAPEGRRGDYLDGGTGDDTLTGGIGDDTFAGGAGADTYADEGGGRNVLSFLGLVNAGSTGANVDLSQTSGTFDVGGELDIVNDVRFTDVAGSRYDDVLRGDANANYLFGGDGNDSIAGGDGPDILVGGLGGDTLEGGDNFDLLIGFSDESDEDPIAFDVLRGGAGFDRALGDADDERDDDIERLFTSLESLLADIT